MKKAALSGKSYAGNVHVRFGGGRSENPWRALFYRAIELAFVVLLATSAFGMEKPEKSLFVHPGPEFAPGVFWFWNNGNVTEEAITKDLEAMADVGLHHVLIMEVGPGLRMLDDKDYGNAPYGGVNFLSDEWRRLFRHVLNEAQRLHISVNMTNGGGWNGTGGWWVKPEDSQKMMVRTELDVVGGRPNERLIVDQPKSRMGFYRDSYLLAWPKEKDTLRPEEVVDLSEEIVSVGGDLNAPGPMLVRNALPKGIWRVVRFGYTTDGKRVHPPPETNHGLEVDKLSKRGAQVGFAGQIARLAAENRDMIGPGKPFVCTHIDSWESGQDNNWTDELPAEFLARRGYELVRYLPVFTGVKIGSADETERFLYDFNKTLGEMILDNYAREMKRLANAQGLALSIEGYGSPNEWTEYSGVADVPMGEFWHAVPYFVNQSVGSAQAAWVYGRNIIGAEAFTSGEHWTKQHPGTMKPLGDQMLASGINRFMFHRYSIQCMWDRTDLAPGMAMGKWGSCYERTQTWWKQSKAFNEYLTRCQYLLRLGRPVADCLRINPESQTSRSIFSFKSFTHSGYNHAQCSTHGVLGLNPTSRGTAVTVGGLEVRLVELPDDEHCQLAMMEKILELVRAGVPVIGRPPTRVWGLRDHAKNEERLKEICAEIWSGERGVFMRKWTGRSEGALAALGVRGDFYSAPRMNWCHRALDGSDIYFVANPVNFPQRFSAHFRARRAKAELWNAETGEICPFTGDELCLGAQESVFVVFSGDPIAIAEPQESLVRTARYGNLDNPVQCVDATSAARTFLSDGVVPVDCVAEVLPVPADVATGELELELVDGRAARGVTHGYACFGERPKINVLAANLDGDLKKELQCLLDEGVNNFELYVPVERFGRKLHGWSAMTYTVECDGRIWSGAAYHCRHPYGGSDESVASFPIGSFEWGKRPQEIPVFVKGLGDWSKSEDENLRYFSGTKEFRGTFDAPMLRAGERLVFDLGEVREFADVSVNGSSFRTLWYGDKRMDISSLVKKGANDFIVRVTNLWPNRLIGDARKPQDQERTKDGRLTDWPAWLKAGRPIPDGRMTFCMWNLYDPDDKLMPSGWIGPVRLLKYPLEADRGLTP